MFEWFHCKGWVSIKRAISTFEYSSIQVHRYWSFNAAIIIEVRVVFVWSERCYLIFSFVRFTSNVNLKFAELMTKCVWHQEQLLQVSYDQRILTTDLVLLPEWNETAFSDALPTEILIFGDCDSSKSTSFVVFVHLTVGVFPANSSGGSKLPIGYLLWAVMTYLAIVPNSCFINYYPFESSNNLSNSSLVTWPEFSLPHAV